MEWITLQFENLKHKLFDKQFDTCFESLAYLDECLLQYEEKTTKETMVSSVKFFLVSRLTGQAAEAPKKEYLSFA